MMSIAAQYLAQDPLLAPIVARIHLPELTGCEDVYAELTASIVGQQLSVKAAATIRERFERLFPAQQPTPALTLGLTDEQLRACGLSGQKTTYVKSAAHYFVAHPLTREAMNTLTDEEIIAQLTQIKGVGRWTVQMLLIFGLCRPDVFAPDDLGIQQAMCKLCGLDAQSKTLRQDMQTIALAWQPYRSTACRYLWRWKDMAA